MGFIAAIQSFFAPLPQGTVRYKGFIIEAQPEEEFGRYRINAVIKKKGRARSFTTIDRFSCKDSCIALTQQKSRNLIDQKAGNIFSLA